MLIISNIYRQPTPSKTPKKSHSNAFEPVSRIAFHNTIHFEPGIPKTHRFSHLPGPNIPVNRISPFSGPERLCYITMLKQMI